WNPPEDQSSVSHALATKALEVRSPRMRATPAGRRDLKLRRGGGRQTVSSAERSADASRMMRHRINERIRNSRAYLQKFTQGPCSTYGIVGYGYVSVQTLGPVSPSSRGAR